MLKALAKTLNVSTACDYAGIGRKTHYYWLETDPEYAAAVEEIEQMKADAMEQAAFQRGVLGFEELVFHQGEVVGKQRRYSDALLSQALKAHRPEKYRDQLQLDANVNHTLVPAAAIDMVMARAFELRRAGSIELEAPEQEGDAAPENNTP